jgi:hypothetical protein
VEGKVVSLDHHNLVDVTSIKSCTEARIVEAYLHEFIALIVT